MDNGETLKELLIELEQQCMKENFLPSLFIIGGLGLAVHFEQLTGQFDGVPLIVAYGKPVSGSQLLSRQQWRLLASWKKLEVK